MTTVPTLQDSDQALVLACLRGDQRAWALLIGRYKRLIYSFPRRYGASEADAADVFQQVCSELFVSLGRLRNYQTLRSWIMTVATHQSYHWKRRHVLRAQREGQDLDAARHAISPAAGPSAQLERLTREQAIRDAIAQLRPRCQTMLRLLFFHDPPVSYEQVARRLGLATGSIGLTRARCLRELERVLQSKGLGPLAPTPVGAKESRRGRRRKSATAPCPCGSPRPWGPSPSRPETDVVHPSRES